MDCGRLTPGLTRQTKDDVSLKPVLVPKLAARAFHLPGYTWYEDFVQYHFNTNPILGVFLHHPFHPVSRLERLFILIGNLTFGIFGTFLVFAYFDQDAYNEAKQKIIDDGKVAIGGVIDVNSLSETVLSAGKVYLWILIVGVLQSIFVVVLWKLNACACFNPGGYFYSSERMDTNRRCLYFGNFIAFVLVLTIISLLVISMNAVCVASGDIASTGGEDTTDWTDKDFWTDNDVACPFTDANFWKLWAYQIAISTVTQLVVDTVKFSGVVSYLFCDKAMCMKFCGGRRAEVRAEQKKQEEDKQETQDELEQDKQVKQEKQEA